MLDPRRLLTFREVVRQGSFSRAAAALARSQPAVSQQMLALERELGTTLLVRGHAGTVPTAAGELLLEHAEALAARLALADDQLAEHVAGERRALRLGAVPSVLATIVPAALAALPALSERDAPGRPTADRAAHGLAVTVEEGRVDALADAVRSGRLHAAVCFQDAALARREHDGLHRTDLAEEPMHALLPAGHPLAGRAGIGLATLADEPWMVPARDGLHVRACRAAGFEPRVTILTSDPLAAVAIAAAGLAVSLTPRLLALRGLPGVATPALLGAAPRRALYAVRPSEGAHPVVPELEAALAAAAARLGAV